MKIRFPILATALTLLPGLSQASTYQERYVESVYYDFEYFFPNFSVAVEEFWDDDTERYLRRASVGSDSGGYACLDPEPDEWGYESGCDTIWFGFFLEGLEILPLDNLTFDLRALPTTLAGRTVGGQYSSLDYNYLENECDYSSSGSISFDPSGEIASYGMGYGRGDCGAMSIWASSTPILLTAWLDDDIVDIDLLDGIMAYDDMYLEPWDLYFSQRPGYWRTSISRSCGYETYYEDDGYWDFTEVACPGDGVVTGPGDPLIIDPPVAAIPLPAAGWLLLGGLGMLGVGTIRRRRG